MLDGASCRIAAVLAGQDVVVVGLPRGGVPVAFEVARALGAPLDVIVVRKLGVPFQPELGMGAVGEGGSPHRRSRDRTPSRGERARTLYRRAARASRGRMPGQPVTGDKTPVPLTGRTVIVVDDGMATGSTARAACHVARSTGRDPRCACGTGRPGGHRATHARERG